MSVCTVASSATFESRSSSGSNWDRQTEARHCARLWPSLEGRLSDLPDSARSQPLNAPNHEPISGTAGRKGFGEAARVSLLPSVLSAFAGHHDAYPVSGEALADMICGNFQHDQSVFPYRSSSVITRFFEDCDTNYVHEGTTRNYWVAETLAKILRETHPNANVPPDTFARVIRT